MPHSYSWVDVGGMGKGRKVVSRYAEEERRKKKKKEERRKKKDLSQNAFCKIHNIILGHYIYHLKIIIIIIPTHKKTPRINQTATGIVIMKLPQTHTLVFQYKFIFS